MSEPRTFEIDVCTHENCGWLISADGDHSTCPYHDKRCDRLNVVEYEPHSSLLPAAEGQP